MAGKLTWFVAALAFMAACAPAPEPNPGSAGLEGLLPSTLPDAQDRLLEELVSRFEAVP